jgi:hypothetical protein
MPEVPGWDEEIHGSIKSLIQLVDDRLPLLTTGENHPQVRQLAAAYLARVRRLVLAMDVLNEAGIPDALGGVLRICLEAWVTGMWVLCTREEAVDLLEAHHRFRSNRLIVDAQLDIEPLGGVDDGRRLPREEDRTEAVERWLVGQGDATAGELMWSFKLVYGGESIAGVHAGVASVVGHLDDQPGWTAVLLNASRCFNCGHTVRAASASRLVAVPFDLHLIHGGEQ